MGPSIAQGGFDDDEDYAEAHEINVMPFIDVRATGATYRPDRIAALIRPGSLHLICERHLGSEALPRKLIDSPPLGPPGPVATGAQVRWIAQLRTGSPLCL